jgi:excisionase family DNA binding protein
MPKRKLAAPVPEALPREGLAKVTEVARALNVSSDTVYREVNDGKLPRVTIRGSIRIPWSAVHKILDSAK